MPQFATHNGKHHIVKSNGKKLTVEQVKHDLKNNAEPFKYPDHQVSRMRLNELKNAKKHSDKVKYFKKYALGNSKGWSMKQSEDDLDNPKEGNVVIGFQTDGDFDSDEKSNAVPLGSYDHFFESMWNERQNSVKNIDDLELKKEIMEERLEEIAEKTAKKSYLLLDDGDYYLVRDV